MGYAGRVADQVRARELRAQGMRIREICAELDASISAVRRWVAHVELPDGSKRATRRPGRLADRRVEETLRLRQEGIATVGRLSDRELLLVGAALYAGEGAKRDGEVLFTNSDPRMIRLFCEWLRRCFEVDERRLRVRLYLHADLGLDAAERHWEEVTGIPRSQFTQPYRAVANDTRRLNRHQFGCASVRYGCAATHRSIMGLVEGLLSSAANLDGIPG